MTNAKPYIARPLSKRNARIQQREAEAEAARLQRFWREQNRHDVRVWAQWDEREKRYVVCSNLINGAPRPQHRHIR